MLDTDLAGSHLLRLTLTSQPFPLLLGEVFPEGGACRYHRELTTPSDTFSNFEQLDCAVYFHSCDWLLSPDPVLEIRPCGYGSLLTELLSRPHRMLRVTFYPPCQSPKGSSACLWRPAGLLICCSLFKMSGPGGSGSHPQSLSESVLTLSPGFKSQSPHFLTPL